MLTADIRSAFLNFFARNDHRVLASSPVVPRGDASLLFANAGMVQFKNVFTGLEVPTFPRVTTAQKCIRAGGKHNDLDQVGFTARHHTFFEMLGNFSFGDYFKEEAIEYAWTFLTAELGIPRSKLLVTIHSSDEDAGRLWRKIAGDITIIPISSSDNFWSMGETGPCGPCSEIFYDHGDDVPGGMPGTADENGDRYVEIWNIVFMQLEKKSDGEMIKLSRQSIDTGMGLERIAAVMQGVCDNYDTDILKKIIESMAAGDGSRDDAQKHSRRAIADHVRAISFLIADGVLPSNEGRGYVLRRILRRALRHGNLMGLTEPFLFKLCDVVVDLMGDAYQELRKAQATIGSVVRLEEEKFLDTLDRGLKMLQQELEQLPSGGLLMGDVAFKLYDTYGFPLDLTQDVLKTHGIGVDLAGFDAALQDQRRRAKWAGSGTSTEGDLWRILRAKLGPTEFCGYETMSCFSQIVAIVQNGEEVQALSSGRAQLLVEKTPFYAESGGQCGDAGEIKTANGLFAVADTKKYGDALIVHEGELLVGSIGVSDLGELAIDRQRRRKIMANHSATHLLQAALKQVLGNHVAQRGSRLDDRGLRFDFSHGSAVTAEDLQKIENLVNSWIIDGLTMQLRVLDRNEAINSGATALFGEKYGDLVRTVRFYNPGSEEEISFELCGGTHVSNSSEIGLFKILFETSIGSGIRRIEAISGIGILHHVIGLEKLLRQSSEPVKCSPEELPAKILSISDELKKKKQELAVWKQRVAMSALHIVEKADLILQYALLEAYSPDDLRGLKDNMSILDRSICIFVSEDHAVGKIHVIVIVGKDLQKQHPASSLLKGAMEIIGGKGGGNAVCAQCSGGNNLQQATDVLEAILRQIS
ncbi:MAG: alanine--tRNA ligase [Holosporaceae bacterium]|jgi:alanyl-tRNA synthetase|nr:alanine--tRNA ligase [Holosporaceae bacterium]